MKYVKVAQSFLGKLHDFDNKFQLLINQSNQHQAENENIELREIIDDYSSFITNPDHEKYWLHLDSSTEIVTLIEKLRANSSVCVKLMEKYRALKLLHENEEIADYFRNIEDCIEKEFGGFQITNQSKVLLVGSGAFPMTLLLIAERTGAEVFGIDIDDEAIQLGRQVVHKLGKHLPIQIYNKPVEDLAAIQQISHIIFSSTVSCKYDILEQLYDVTKQDVIVAMRYGDGLKSLFNYPMRTVDATKWQLVEQIMHPQSVFDIALYQKAQSI